ncbi:MAG TPA: helix-turn-helix transcriptional regulator [Ktedonobacteraceae bacterium]|nr:helix-turn-helix transcriptional regulator [Ktedonobacteraceae bacterium]
MEQKKYRDQCRFDAWNKAGRLEQHFYDRKARWENWNMKHFGAFLCNLRSNAGLSLGELAPLVETSKSALSRLENDEVAQPFKGAVRKQVLALAAILCNSKRETERYLELAGIERSELTEFEEFQLGFIPNIPIGSTDETANLEHFERLCDERLRELGTYEIKLGISSSPRSLKVKIQEYTNTLHQIRLRLHKDQNGHELLQTGDIQTIETHYASELEGRLVVGYQYGEELSKVLMPNSLYSLASPSARWLMQLAEIERFAVDDCIILTNSRSFAGWEPDEMKTTVLSKPLPIPDDLEEVRQAKIPTIEKHYFNSSHYRLSSFTPSFSDFGRLEIVLAPLSYYDYYSIIPFLDEPLLTALDGSKISIRQKYGNTALTYSATDRGTAFIPTPVSLQCVVVTQDHQIVLMQRSSSVAYYPDHWSASFEETMNAPGVDRKGRPSRSDDADFFTGAIRGLQEEFAIPSDAVESVKILSLNVEYLTLSVDVIILININLSSEEIRQHWIVEAWDREEASRFAMFSTDLNEVVNKLFSKTLWHPTSRMRLIQFLFHTYGVKEAAKAIQARV